MYVPAFTALLAALVAAIVSEPTLPVFKSEESTPPELVVSTFSLSTMLFPTAIKTSALSVEVFVIAAPTAVAVSVICLAAVWATVQSATVAHVTAVIFIVVALAGPSLSAWISWSVPTSSIKTNSSKMLPSPSESIMTDPAGRVKPAFVKVPLLPWAIVAVARSKSPNANSSQSAFTPPEASYLPSAAEPAAPAAPPVVPQVVLAIAPCVFDESARASVTLSFTPSVSETINSASKTPVFLPVSTTDIILALDSSWTVDQSFTWNVFTAEV